MAHPFTAVRTALALAAIAATAALLAGCTASTVSLDPAPDANDPLCADIIVRLPDAVDGQERRWTDAQATGAWGDPAAVLLTCGVTPPGPTEAQCIEIGGVDWIVDDSQEPNYLITTYGRTPAVQLFVDNERVSPNDVLAAMAPHVVEFPQDAACVGTQTRLP
ncbi:DUF3515 family protein [Microbacterium sp. SSW1-59]|uniref:DUF3515 family protein n=1 Tax=Microbacterium xanthum TaxID=3079794 RepID=UPI002AD35662|nr:DUF3515 family protein [Microbacterium sp. SSW1-59]MDZ8201976.1 DUF3515 family protein [Microbacterium sp. SSW1-59]